MSSFDDFEIEEHIEHYSTPDPALGLREEDPVPIEHWHFSKHESRWAHYLFQMWGLNMMWMTVLGGLIYSWYPGMIRRNWWWKLQCPQSAWTTAAINAYTGINKDVGDSIIQPVGVNDWTQWKCLNAAPIRQWNW